MSVRAAGAEKNLDLRCYYSGLLEESAAMVSAPISDCVLSIPVESIVVSVPSSLVLLLQAARLRTILRLTIEATFTIVFIRYFF